MGETTELRLWERELSEVSEILLYLLGDHEEQGGPLTIQWPLRHGQGNSQITGERGPLVSGIRLRV